MQLKKCSKCGEVKPTTDFYKHKSGKNGIHPRCKACLYKVSRAWALANPERRKANSRRNNCKTRQRNRAAVLALLGGVCAHCGFADPRALQIDHINGGGAAEINAITHHGVVRKVLAGAQGYQLLCANCNWIKRKVNAEGPGKPCCEDC